MDIYGNRELLYEGEHNVLYAQPVRPRKVPALLPDIADMPGSERKSPTVRPGLLFSNNIFAGARRRFASRAGISASSRCCRRTTRSASSAPAENRLAAPDRTRLGAHGASGFSRTRRRCRRPTFRGATARSSPAPPRRLTGPLSVKQVHGTVPIGPDGSVCFEAPPCRMLYFQVLDERQRAIHTMRSWVSVRPGEQRGCVGCHEMHNSTAAIERPVVGRSPPRFNLRRGVCARLSYVKDIQPIFDRACGRMPRPRRPGRRKLDLTLRPDPLGTETLGRHLPRTLSDAALGPGPREGRRRLPPFQRPERLRRRAQHAGHTLRHAAAVELIFRPRAG